MRHDPHQLLLFDEPVSLPTTSRARARLLPDKFFFGVRPPTAMAPIVAQLGATLASQHGGVPLNAGNLHISLNGIGAYATIPHDIINHAVTMAASVTTAPFEVVFDRFLTWGRGQSRPTVLRCASGEAELKALYAAIYAAMTRGGLSAKAAPGVPHMTLLYGGAVLPEQHLPQPFGWCVDRFYLIHSIHGTRRHELRAEWSLKGASTDPPNAPGLLF